MYDFNKIIVTKIEKPVVVHSEKGREFQMKDRPVCGLSLCLSGQITYEMNGKYYVSNQNNAILLPQGGTYSLYGDKEGLFPVINFNCENYDGDEILVLPLEDPQGCINRFETLKELFLYKESRFKIYSAFYELLSKVSSENAPEHDPLASVMKHIEENISDGELTNTELAKQMGISEVYLRKLFMEHYKTTPKQYILDIRLRKAKQMLVDTSFSVTAIAEACGFSSLYHFCRAFKNKTGRTPTEYAKINKIYHI